jgi:hypothetical protein
VEEEAERPREPEPWLGLRLIRDRGRERPRGPEEHPLQERQETRALLADVQHGRLRLVEHVVGVPHLEREQDLDPPLPLPDREPLEALEPRGEAVVHGDRTDALAHVASWSRARGQRRDRSVPAAARRGKGACTLTFGVGLPGQDPIDARRSVRRPPSAALTTSRSSGVPARAAAATAGRHGRLRRSEAPNSSSLHHSVELHDRVDGVAVAPRPCAGAPIPSCVNIENASKYARPSVSLPSRKL